MSRAMTIDEQTSEFGGKPVKDYDPQAGLPEAASTAYRIAIGWDRYENNETAPDVFASLVQDPQAAQLTALIFGDWGGTAEGKTSEPIVGALVAAADKLPNLTALFLGDMTFEECECSWINHGDVSALYGAFPRLEELRVRGSTGLSLGRVKHVNIRRLTIESGGLDVGVVRSVVAAELPNLEHLELWLGDDGYGWNGRVGDLMPLLTEARFPKLKYLGLRNSQIADEIAQAAASSPILPSLDMLDLSLGTMTDAAVEALASSTAIRSLKTLDVHRNYLSDAGVARLRKLGVGLIADDQQVAEDGDRYVAVSE